MRVLHIGKYFPPRYGGIESFMSELMKEQASLGFIVAGIVHEEDIARCDSMPQKSKKYRWHSCDIYPVKSYGQLIFAPIAPTYPFRLLKVLRQFMPDIVHVHMPNLSAFWLLFHTLFYCRQAKVMVHWHSDVLGAEPTKLVRLFYPLYAILERWLLKRAKGIICTSEPYRLTSKPLQPFLNKTVSIPLAIPKVSKIEAKQASDDTFRFLMIGRLSYYKGHTLVLQAFQQLIEEGYSCMLTIIGDGAEKEAILAMLADLKIEAYVHITGKVSEAEKQAHLCSSDLLLLPSVERTEAFGIVTLEAASVGLSALVSDVHGSGMTFFVKHMENGLVVKAGDINDLRNKMQYAVHNRAQVLELGKRSFEKYHTSFTLDTICKQITAVYDG